MNSIFGNVMLQATKLTRSQSVLEATRMIQRALAKREPPQEGPHEGPELLAPATDRAQSDDVGDLAERKRRTTSAPLGDAAFEERPAPRMKMPLGNVLELLRQADPDLRDGLAPFTKSRKASETRIPDGAAYFTRSHSCEAGTRDYKVYVPSHAGVHKRPLIVMLHGCTQNPDDFAMGTGMNRLADEHGFIVAYPRQPATVNPGSCWNWFNIADQMRDRGEPSIIAGITRELISELCIDPKRVYVAGLSAGGAMAAIMSATYPEIYAAAGIHSGLPHGSATDVASAFAAMRGDSFPAAASLSRPRRGGSIGPRRVIVFHGTSDQTVHPSNSEAIFADARAGLSIPETRHSGWVGGRAYTRRVVADADGVTHAEHWRIEGLGHAWSGGNAEGSYTDRNGPDASSEMLRFFVNAQA